MICRHSENVVRNGETIQDPETGQNWALLKPRVASIRAAYSNRRISGPWRWQISSPESLFGVLRRLGMHCIYCTCIELRFRSGLVG